MHVKNRGRPGTSTNGFMAGRVFGGSAHGRKYSSLSSSSSLLAWNRLERRTKAFVVLGGFIIMFLLWQSYTRRVIINAIQNDANGIPTMDNSLEVTISKTDPHENENIRPKIDTDHLDELDYHTISNNNKADPKPQGNTNRDMIENDNDNNNKFENEIENEIQIERNENGIELELASSNGREEERREEEKDDDEEEEEAVPTLTTPPEAIETNSKKLKMVDQKYNQKKRRKVLLRENYRKSLERFLKASCDIINFNGNENIKQICCTLNVNKRVCLPNMIVMGAQKGGTTALHSYLMLDNSLKAASKKELHIWDSDRSFKAWPTGIPKAFRSNEDEEGHKLFFESSPSYIASTMACQRMSSWLPPWSTFVLILRDPVKRFWSEYNMKSRRIEKQDVTMHSMIENSNAIIRCLTNPSSDPQHESARLRGRDHYEDKFRRNNPHDDGAETITASKDSCIDNLVSGKNAPIKGTPPKLNIIKKALKRLEYNDNFVVECLKKTLNSLEEKRACFKSYGILREELPKLPDIVLDEMKRLQPCVSQEFPVVDANFTASSISVDQSSCDSFVNVKCQECSVDSYDRNECLAACVYKTPKLQAQLHHRGCDDGQYLVQKSQNPIKKYPAERLLRPDACEGPQCKCYPNARNFADISKNFLWRGLYYPQLVNCFRHIPRDQIIIIENDDLRKRTNETLNYILKRSGLPQFDYSKHTWQEASDAFDKAYPNFEFITGWSADGSSSKKMPDDLQLMLQNFYKEPNERLFKLLGYRFDHWL